MRSFKFITTIFVIALLLVNCSSAQESTQERQTLNVIGNGEVFISPDVANISFSVETTSKTAALAVKENAEDTNNVLTALKSKIGQEDKLSTSNYNLSPIYEYNNQTKKSEFKGYRVTNTVTLKSYNLDNLGALIDAAAQVGSNKIQGLSFDTTKRNDYRREAMVKAVKDARSTADTVADAAGVKITTIYQISPSYSYPSPVYRDFSRGKASFAEAAATPIEAGEISVKATVNMVFGIE